VSVMRNERLWAYRDTGWAAAESPIAGYSVQARDGSIGTVDDATYEVGSSYVVVDTGPWIFGSKVMLPAGVLSGIDHDRRTVSVGLTKDEVKNSPPFEEASYQSEDYRTALGSYYEPFHQREAVQPPPGTR
jgi:hypothetical protein